MSCAEAVFQPFNIGVATREGAARGMDIKMPVMDELRRRAPSAP